MSVAYIEAQKAALKSVRLRERGQHDHSIAWIARTFAGEWGLDQDSCKMLETFLREQGR